MLISRASKAREELALPTAAKVDELQRGRLSGPLAPFLPGPYVITRTGRRLGKKVATATSLVFANPLELVRTLAGRSERYVCFVADPRDIPAPPPVADWEVRKIGEEVLIELARSRPDIQAQRMRLAEGRLNDAYGIFVGDSLAGVAWMIPSAHDELYAVRNVKLRPGEVELTHCLTLPEFRGRGLYTYMIRSLCALAAQHNVKRVYMITNRKNVASQGGIRKAGLEPTGGIHRHVFDFIGPRAALTLRRHRWGPLGWK